MELSLKKSSDKLFSPNRIKLKRNIQVMSSAVVSVYNKRNVHQAGQHHILKSPPRGGGL